MSRLVRSLLRRYPLDLVVVGLAGAAVVEFVAARAAGGIPSGSLAVAVPAILALTLPLLAVRRFPFGAPAVAVTSNAGFSFLDARVTSHLFFTLLAGLLVAFLFAYLNDRRHAVGGLFLTWAMGTVAARNDAVNPGIGDVVFVVVIHGLAWLSGLALNRRLEQERAAEERIARLEREREERALAAVTLERSRIARELHDVVGHHLSVMTVQAGAVRRLLHDDQRRERESLESVERTGREALREMRRMVGVLREGTEPPVLAPQPGLDQLRKLLDQTGEAGLAVTLRVEGEPVRLPAGLDLTAFRVVQEGLTNALKHGRARTAQVVVHYGTDAVAVVVDDDGRGKADAEDGAAGHGHIGLRERVAVYGGELEAGPRTGGGYRLCARLPLSAS